MLIAAAGSRLRRVCDVTPATPQHAHGSPGEGNIASPQVSPLAIAPFLHHPPGGRLHSTALLLARTACPFAEIYLPCQAATLRSREGATAQVFWLHAPNRAAMWGGDAPSLQAKPAKTSKELNNAIADDLRKEVRRCGGRPREGPRPVSGAASHHAPSCACGHSETPHDRVSSNTYRGPRSPARLHIRHGR